MAVARALSQELTVVVPAYRAEPTLARALDSVLGQQQAPSVVVVIDGRDDRTEAIACRYPDVQVLVNEQNQGAQKSRNRGLAAAETEFVTFLDCDDYVEGNLHEGMVRAMQRDAAEMVFCSSISEGPNGRGCVNSANIFRACLRDTDALLLRWFRGPSALTGAVGWRTASLRKIGGWDPNISKAQDFEVGLRSIMRELKVTVNVEGALIYVNHTGMSRISRQNASAIMRSHDAMLSAVLRYAHERGSSVKIRHAVGERYYELAAALFFEGSGELGEIVLQKSRDLGFHGHTGTWKHRLLSRTLGLARKEAVSRAAAWIRNRADRAKIM